jgi:hypothetical protein
MAAKLKIEKRGDEILIKMWVDLDMPHIFAI